MKCSVIFKPDQSRINQDLTNLWYYEYKFKEFYSIDKIKFPKKIKISKVPYDQIARLYEYCSDILTDDYTVLILSNIINLFEND
jgi:hypothetical protein